jgi:hypothetical protein
MQNAIVAGVLVLLLTGCAYGVEDQQPPPDPPAEPRSPPTETLSGDLSEPPAPMLKAGLLHAPAFEAPPLPHIDELSAGATR